MVPFDVRWVANDVETYGFGAQTTTWSAKVLSNNCINILHVPHNLYTASCSGVQ